MVLSAPGADMVKNWTESIILIFSRLRNWGYYITVFVFAPFQANAKEPLFTCPYDEIVSYRTVKYSLKPSANM